MCKLPIPTLIDYTSICCTLLLDNTGLLAYSDSFKTRKKCRGKRASLDQLIFSTRSSLFGSKTVAVTVVNVSVSGKNCYPNGKPKHKYGANFIISALLLCNLAQI